MDSFFLGLRKRVEANAARTARAASPSNPVEATVAPATGPFVDDDDDDNNADSDDGGDFATIAAGALLTPDLRTPGRAVAVPFCIDGHETHCPGEIVTVATKTATVRFEDGTYRVNHDRLFSVGPPADTEPPTPPDGAPRG